ncbi:diguanylate cyclase (GGDEF domain) [Sulfurimonas gotlandica GD1]|uniref:diguanylate cyclase n=1 Tax=Sulfurimonas gotlandica (strain DSM 19862 / JCM 16533 / GD1) TaxID=929558 RepID=B6BKQ4_SULGG|nr:diguanylate cyclase [Sulfurimonas gotlandica]EDZ62431.1 diguanylate cyclase [Sulfurimonas gotlandica GD1]EHP29113.1 diguanylate cyclase (GGDEF domain) [Sulfurimonas gotlandica GD1]
MQFVEALKLRSKLFFLFMLITIGLVLVGVMGYLNINSMKKNLDSLYFGSLVPVTELNEILQIYHGSIANTIYKARNSEISSSQTSSEIESSILNIEILWRSYESHFKRDEELQYVQYTDLEIIATNDYFKKILDGLLAGRTIDDISMESFEKRVEHIHTTLNKLINYEVEVAQYERKNFLKVYESIIQNVGIILTMIIFGVLIISYYVFKSIQNDHTRLEITTKKLQRANKKLENVSYTDSLTSLHNRRYFNFIYDRELKRAKRTKSYITFMMLDIDFFKQYNDTYGHLEGDFALKSVSKVLRDSLKRPSDYVFRLGGEEFGVVLIDTDESNSARLAREICDAVRAREIKHESSKANEFLTISIGVVCCVADEALDEEILISRADEMLYKAKESGRNGYIITTNVSEATAQRTEKIGA